MNKDHANPVAGYADRLRQTEAGRAELRESIIAQAAYYRRIGDAKRAAECEAEAEALA